MIDIHGAQASRREVLAVRLTDNYLSIVLYGVSPSLSEVNAWGIYRVPTRHPDPSKEGNPSLVLLHLFQVLFSKFYEL